MLDRRGDLSRTLFSKKERIKNKSEITRIILNGQKWECSGYRIYYEISNEKNDRVAVILSKKVGNAVKRNKIKRVFREIFRTKIRKNPPFYDVLIQPRRGIKINENKEIENCFELWQTSSKK